MVLFALYILVHLSVYLYPPPTHTQTVCFLKRVPCLTHLWFQMLKWCPLHSRHLVNVRGMHEVVRPEEISHKCIADEPKDFLNLFSKPGWILMELRLNHSFLTIVVHFQTIGKLVPSWDNICTIKIRSVKWLYHNVSCLVVM